MPVDLTLQQFGLLFLLAVTFGLLITEWLPNDIVALLVVLVLAVTGLLSPRDALSGFSSEPAIVVASVFVLAAALEQTGISSDVGAWMSHVAGRGYRSTVAVIMASVAALSVFTHHVTTTAMLLPVTTQIAQKRQLPASLFLIPLSFAASLGTTVTIIGAPAFLVASAALQQGGYPGLGIFSIAPIGIALTIAGIAFIVVFGKMLLPRHDDPGQLGDRSDIDNYFTELIIRADARFVGKSLADTMRIGHFQFTVVGWLRGQQALPGPYGALRLQAGDVLLVHTTPSDLAALRHERGLELRAVEKFRLGKRGSLRHADGEHVVQAVVAPNSDFINRTLREIDFRRRFGAIVIGFWRRGELLQSALADIRLQAGDVLVLQGDADSLTRVERLPAVLLLAPLHGEPRRRHKAPVVILIVAAVIVATIFSILPLDIAMLAGAVAIVLAGCLTPDQAYRAIDKRIYIFIAGAIPLGLAMQQTGTADLLADQLNRVVGGWPEWAVLLMLYLIVGLVTQIMSDAATVALFAPVAVALAKMTGAPPEAYVVTVAMAAVTACLTPTGHHGNLLVYGPGRYRYVDFLRIGVPFTALIGILVALLATLLW